MKNHIHCPVNDWDCPYYKNGPQPCMCTLENPLKNATISMQFGEIVNRKNILMTI